VIVALRFVMPVTTASGKVAGGETVGLGVAVGDGWRVAALREGTRLGLGLAHPRSSVTTATAATPRSVAGVFTAVS
jgi:hypothetical protein